MLPVSSTSSASTPSRNHNRRRPYSQRNNLVRNSSLFGSIKNFVSAPFSRLFASEEFDDETDETGKRRRNSDFVQDSPAPPKRLRVHSPSLSPSPPPRTPYLDPPTSAFRQSSSSLHRSPSRSASITIQPTTLSDSNSRSTISPLRRQLSSGMTIDPHPAHNRGLARDVSMASIPPSSIGQREVKARHNQHIPERELSMPPLSGRPTFVMRSSMTPQPQRDLSEPPPMTSLSSYPVFVRGPSQPKESQPKQVATTLGSLVDSQRNVQSSAHQRPSTLFGQAARNNPQATVAEKVLHELDFYKTPLVPSRLRSKASRTVPSDITDMFSRKHSLVLMGDDKRNIRLGKKGRKDMKEKTKEDNESKPYAGTTGLKKRLAKHKKEARAENSKEDAAPTFQSPSAAVPPPPIEKDTSSFAPTSLPSSSPQTSSLRVGRAARTHLSRPTRKPKFSAAYEEEDEVTDETRRELAELQEAAKMVPVFQVPEGFSFAKEDLSSAKEPPITSLPFSLSQSPLPKPTTGQQDGPSKVALDPWNSASPPQPESAPPPVEPITEKPDTTSPSSPPTIGKVPNFFAGSKILTSQTTHSPTPTALPTLSVDKSSSSFFAAPPTSGLMTASVPVKETTGSFSFAPLNTEKEDAHTASAYSIPSFTPPISSAPTFNGLKKDEPSFKPSLEGPVASSSFSFANPVETSSISAGSSFSFAGSSNDATLPPTLFSSTTSPGLSGRTSSPKPAAENGSAAPLSSSQATDPMSQDKTSSIFGGSRSTKVDDTLSSSSMSAAPSSSPFSFGQLQKTEQSSTLFGTAPAEKPAPAFSFGQPSPAIPIPTSTSTPSFSFGGSSAANTTQNPFKTTSESKNDLGGDTGANASKPFSFGTGSSTSTTSEAKPFSFNTDATASTTAFGGSKPFSFGFPSRPVTPPNQEQEVKMDESPTRDIAVKATEQRPSLGGFSFSSSPFGQSSGNQTAESATPSTSFTFGVAPSSSGFGQMKDESSKPFSFGPAQTGSNSSGSSNVFAFGTGNKAAENEPSRPSTTGSFSFGSPSSATPSFSFGTSSAPSSNPFGQSQSGSAPSSPSIFGQQPSFSGSSTNPFGFGSQPASPATPNASLPQSSFGNSNGFGSAPSPGGSSLFTIGAAPTNITNPQGRPTKRLPKRGGKR